MLEVRLFGELEAECAGPAAGGTPAAEAVLAALLNDLAAIAGDVVLVLDDYPVNDFDCRASHPPPVTLCLARAKLDEHVCARAVLATDRVTGAAVAAAPKDDLRAAGLAHPPVVMPAIRWRRNI